MNRIPFEGVIAYPITPFNDQDQVDLPLFRNLLERLVVSGAHGIAPLGSTGVLPYLSREEEEALTEATLQQVNGRLPVVVGVSHLTTADTIYHARFAEKAGAAAVMILPISYWKLSDEEIFRHYESVAGAISIPIMAYNNPATSGIDMSPALLKRLLGIDHVTMIKESSGDIHRMHLLQQALGDDAALYNGSNPMALAAFAAGARGWCTAAPNLIPEHNNALYQAIRQNDLAAAQASYARQAGLLRFIVAKGLPRAVQAGLELRGVAAGNLRKPLLPLSTDEQNTLQELLAACN